MKTLVTVALIVGVIAAAGYVAHDRWWKDAPEVHYVTARIEQGTIKSEVLCTGTLNPLNQVIVGSQVSGTIGKLYVDFESQVRKGQLVALIDPRIFEAKVAQAKADLEAAEAGLAKSRVTLVDKLRDLRRKEGLFEKRSISESQHDEAKTAADAAAAQVEADKAKVAQMRAKLAEADQQLKYTRIVAPVDGVVTSRDVDEGQTVAASFQAPVLFTIAEDLNRMQVHANVDEADVGQVEVGQEATFTAPAFPDTVFHAKVTQIRNKPVVEQSVVTYTVVLDVSNQELKLRPGMTANVAILLKKADDALMAPSQALRFNPPASNAAHKIMLGLPELKPGEGRIWLVGKKNRIRPVTVRIGIKGTEKVQISAPDIRKGQRVALDQVRTSTRSRGLRGLRF